MGTGTGPGMGMNMGAGFRHEHGHGGGRERADIMHQPVGMGKKCRKTACKPGKRTKSGVYCSPTAGNASDLPTRTPLVPPRNPAPAHVRIHSSTFTIAAVRIANRRRLTIFRLTHNRLCGPLGARCGLTTP